jgi:hypothetical protein
VMGKFLSLRVAPSLSAIAYMGQGIRAPGSVGTRGQPWADGVACVAKASWVSGRGRLPPCAD